MSMLIAPTAAPLGNAEAAFEASGEFSAGSCRRATNSSWITWPPPAEGPPPHLSVLVCEEQPGGMLKHYRRRAA
jgi:hypothetical protein